LIDNTYNKVGDTVCKDIEILIRLVLALLLGGLIGLERERHERPAGFRTHILVSIGSALLMIISVRMVDYNYMADPGRIAAQVVSGIGFLGAGTIIRDGFSVKGLTTAASLWTTAAIGLASGAGYYYIASLATVIVFITLFFFYLLESGIVKSELNRKLTCRINDVPGVFGGIGIVLGNENINISNVSIERNEVEGELFIEFDVKLPRELEIAYINQKLLEIQGLIEISWSDS
jgi:putative Mg2+ transporter-C (MgtC) family protein